MAVCPHCERRSDTALVACPSCDGFYLVDDAVYASDSDDKMLGRCIAGRFIISSILGRGAMGTVYRARQEQVDRDVAVKIFRADSLIYKRLGGNSSVQEREAAQARFVQEARVLGKLSHPNCVTVYDFGMEDEHDFMYMAMEYVAGVSLHKAIHRGLKFEAVVEITRQILMALREAHTLGIVHRDLKPENIILSYRFHTGEQIVKVLDFGIAKLLQSSEDSMTRAGALFGTPAYMSPEQCRGELGAIGPQADIYALGCILYEMLCGQLPYVTQIPQQMVRLHQQAPIPALNLRRGFKIPPGMDDFIRTCLAKERKDRFADASAAIVAFEQVMEGFGGDARPVELTATDSGLWARPGVSRGTRGVVLPQDHVSGGVLDPVGRRSAPAPEADSEAAASGATSGAKAPLAGSAPPANRAPLRARNDPAEDTDPPQVSLPLRPSVRATVVGKSARSTRSSPGGSNQLLKRALLAALSLAVCVALIVMIFYFWG